MGRITRTVPFPPTIITWSLRLATVWKRLAQLALLRWFQALGHYRSLVGWISRKAALILLSQPELQVLRIEPRAFCYTLSIGSWCSFPRNSLGLTFYQAWSACTHLFYSLFIQYCHEWRFCFQQAFGHLMLCYLLTMGNMYVTFLQWEEVVQLNECNGSKYREPVWRSG